MVRAGLFLKGFAMTANFDMGALVDWREAVVGDLLLFEVPVDGYRNVRFDMCADRFVSVHAIAGDKTWLVGCGEGRFDVAFSTNESVAICVFGDKDAVVFMRTHVATQVVGESGEASFTSIEPRPAGPSDEIRRLMLMMRLNAERREAQLRQEFDAKRWGLKPAGKPPGSGWSIGAAAAPPSHSPLGQSGSACESCNPRAG